MNLNNITNEKVELYEENGKQYLRLDFDYEDSRGYYKGHIERICLNVKLLGFSQEYGGYGLNACYVDLGLDKLLVSPNDGTYYTLALVKEKVQEMTMEEIEKKLGHKVKIVTKK